MNKVTSASAHSPPRALSGPSPRPQADDLVKNMGWLPRDKLARDACLLPAIQAALAEDPPAMHTPDSFGALHHLEIATVYALELLLPNVTTLDKPVLELLLEVVETLQAPVAGQANDVLKAHPVPNPPTSGPSNKKFDPLTLMEKEFLSRPMGLGLKQAVARGERLFDAALRTGQIDAWIEREDIDAIDRLATHLENGYRHTLWRV